MRAGAALIATLFVLLCTAGCAEIPQQEIDSAMAAYTLAEKADAEHLASAAWRELQDAKSALDTELETQTAKSGFARSYVDAQDLCTKLQTAADYAHKEAQKGKERVKVEFMDFRTAADTAITEAEDKVGKIRRNRRTRMNYDERMATIETAKTTLEEALADYEAGNLWDAREKARLLPEALAPAVDGLD